MLFVFDIEVVVGVADILLVVFKDIGFLVIGVFGVFVGEVAAIFGNKVNKDKAFFAVVKIKAVVVNLGLGFDCFGKNKGGIIIAG